MNTSTYQPNVKYRILATDWEGESYTECWTQNLESAQTIASALRKRGGGGGGGGDLTVQIDEVSQDAPEDSHGARHYE